MANIQAINVGKVDNDKTGDTLRVAMQKVNANFTEVQTGLAGVWDASNLGASVDLNTIIKPGRYHQSRNVDAQTGVNYPIANAGFLEVGASSDGTFVYQEYTQYRSGAYSRRFWRSLYGGTWATWQELPALSQKGAANGLATLDVNGKVPVAQIPVPYSTALPTTAHDLNDYITPGSFYQTTIAGATAGTNYPVANVGFLEVTATGTPVVQVFTTRTNVVNAMQRFWRVRMSATSWSAWKELADVTTVISYAGAMPAAQDLNTYTQRGLWAVGASTTASGGTNFPIGQSGYLLVYSAAPLGGAAVTSGVVQIYCAANGNKTYMRSLINGGWSVWAMSLDSTMSGAVNGVATLDAAGKVPVSQMPIVSGTPLGSTQDLNDYVTPGVYSQNTNAGATGGSNYPIALAGLLEVQFGTGTNNGVYQTYTAYTLGNPRKFFRNRFANTWGAWFELARVDQALTHVYLTAATDANTLVADNVFYTWVASSVMGQNFPPTGPSAGYLRIYYTAATIIAQECTVLANGQKPRVFHRLGNSATNVWQPWKMVSSVSGLAALPTADCGDVYVDSAGWHRWNGTAYARFNPSITQDLTFDSATWKIRGEMGFGPSAGGVFQSNSGAGNINVVPGSAVAGSRANVWQDNGANSSVLSLQCSSTGAYVSSTRTGSGAYQPLIFEVVGQEAGRINTAATWVLGKEYNRNYLVRQGINFEGGGTRFGTLYSPQADNTTAIVFTNAAGTAVGSIGITPASTIYNTTSDYRVKHDVVDMGGAWALHSVLRMRPVLYKWNVDNSDGEGFIAHELQAEAPSAVSGQKDAMMEMPGFEDKPALQGIDPSKLVARLVAAVQEQQRQINALTERVEHLESLASATSSATEG